MAKLLPEHHLGLCSAPQVSLWFRAGIAVGFLLLSHILIQSEPAFLPQGIHQGIIEGDFALCISLYHGYELLLQMGIRSLFIYLWGIMDGSKGEHHQEHPHSAPCSSPCGESWMDPKLSIHPQEQLPGIPTLLLAFSSLWGWFGTKHLKEGGMQMDLVLCSPCVGVTLGEPVCYK